MAAQQLSSAQVSALFDILSHYETYSDIENFKHPGFCSTYGPPFKIEAGKPSTAPLLQTLLSKFVLTLPGLRDVSPDFWEQRSKGLIEAFEDAELSESYDKGAIGIRKTLTTAISAIIEYPARGCLGGYPKEETQNPNEKYDTSNAGDLERAWKNFLQDLTYGDLIDELFAKAAETDQLKDHRPVVQAAHQYVVINLASALHFALVLHPKGQTMLGLIERVNRLIPYSLVKQTLKVGNVATMISGMTKIFLAKLSLSSVTNWLGLSQSADEGMNLLQQIISTVLGWDIKDLKSRAARIEKDAHAPSKEHLAALKTYPTKSRQEHERYRAKSKERSKSIVHIILSEASLSTQLTEKQHTQALEYLAIILSIRDREEIVRVLCQYQPDLLTQLVKDLVAAYEPIIRSVHNAADLSATVADAQLFVDDLIKISKTGGESKDKSGHGKKESDAHVPSVQDFFRLILRHQSSSHRFLHEVAKNGPEVTKAWHDYSLYAASQFRLHKTGDSSNSTSSDSRSTGSKDGKQRPRGRSMTASLEALLSDLSEDNRTKVAKQVDAYAKYLEELHQASRNRLSSMLSNTGAGGSTTFGPGMYLMKWQDLLDNTPITPATMDGKVRFGKHDSVRDAGRVEVDGEKKGGLGPGSVGTGERKAAELRPPDVSDVVRLLGPGFKEVLAEQYKDW